MTKKTKRRKPEWAKKQPKRIVLGTGHPWFFSAGAKNTSFTAVRLTKTPVPAFILFRTGEEKLIDLDPKGAGNWNKCRLVLEVLE